MKLRALLEECEYKVVKGDVNTNIEYITEMEEECRENSLFILYKDDEGLPEIETARKNGAIAVVAEEALDVEGDFVYITVPDARKAMAKISKKYFNNPTFNFRLIGVTGSSGKTDVIRLIARILKKNNKKIGTIGTEKNYIDGVVLEDRNIAQNTIKLQHLFHEMAVENVSDVVMEVSSRTIAGDRVYGVNYDVAVFTNLHYDESDDFYKDLDDYKNNKREIFKKSAKAAVNMDDESYLCMIKGIEFRTLLTYSVENESADLYAYDLEEGDFGRRFTLRYLDEDYRVEMSCGDFDIHTVLAAMGACLLSNNSMKNIMKGLCG